MGKANNLGDFMTDLADAIREKTGTTDAINPQDFSEKIKNIQSGGAVTPEGDVTFYDCDGMVLHAFTKDQFLSMTEMPSLPTQRGLTCQGWNWDFQSAKEYVANYGGVAIGAVYITDDEKTRLYISIEDDRRMNVPICFSQSISEGVVVDWGDGSTPETIEGTNDILISHQYGSIGDYCIALDVADGCSLTLSGDASGNTLMGASSGVGNVAYKNMLRKVEVGRGVTKFGQRCFYGCFSLECVTIPNNVAAIDTYGFYVCDSLKFAVMPNGLSLGTSSFEQCGSLTMVVLPSDADYIPSRLFHSCYSLKRLYIPPPSKAVGDYCCQNCYSIREVVLHNTLTKIGVNAFYDCRALGAIKIPNSVTTMGGSVFRNCYSLREIVLPPNLSALPSSVAYSCKSLVKFNIPSYATSIDGGLSSCESLVSLKIPKTVTSLASYAFQSCTSMALYDFSEHEAVPTLGSNSFTSIPSDCKIVVPDALYDEWIAATNWSSKASYIIKKTDWDAQNA